LNSLDLEAAAAHELELTKYAQGILDTYEGLHIIGEAKNKTSVVSFTIDNMHPFDLGTLLDKQGIAVRTGHHCAWPLTRSLGVPATTRASLYLYNTIEDNDALIEGINSAMRYFK
jgi:cysteine desulfurase/selenocysteine lyase